MSYTCDLCGAPAKHDVEYNVYQEASVNEHYCDEHMQNVLDDFNDGNYTERLRVRHPLTFLFFTVKKGTFTTVDALYNNLLTTI